MDRESSFDELAYRYLEGKLKGREYDDFTALLQESDKLARFDQLKSGWQPGENLSSAANWRRLSYRMSTTSVPAKAKPRNLVTYWISAVAAVLIIGLIISTTFFYLKSDRFITGYTTIETPRGEKSKVFLPDGTEVWLNANSSISYPSFSKDQREVKLVGEAYFKVKHDDNIPFVVSTKRCDVKVLGTEFNVMAYDLLNRNEVTLFKGRVEVKAGTKSAVLKVGQRFFISDDQQYIESANLQQTHSWVENKLNFQKIPFGELVMRLENWYDVDLIYDTKRFAKTEFTGTFKNEETIWQVLDALNVYLPIQYKKIDNRKIELYVKEK
ncbi:FecR family protein [Mangrovibacterium diazotrophicum]|uniref:FecR family protein n=1 Tax=Mangrovibacterium diazotrophicum TaxID=1261403 RepID=A0A419W647_9BACT|nr:FecR domain-containing protein [Mangrovibacterium diazotrophicum]RKD90943.1 FecR family protein [Mangrovibacterium diazotrophicum]